MPIMPHAQIKDLVLTGEIAAFSIDTSVYDAQHFGFEAGLLATLTQFKDSEIRFLMVDMVRYEVTEHIKAEAKLVRSQFQNAMKPLLNAWGTSNEVRNRIKELVFGDDTEVERTEERVSRFEEITGSELVCVADYANSKDVVDLYFKKSPPFSERKKEEFPDAFILMALEGWAEENEVKVIVIAKDGDWRQFCEHSPNLVYVDDLSLGLSVFNVNANDALALVKRLIVAGEFGDFLELLCNEMNVESFKISATLEASSSYSYEEDLNEITIDSIEQDIDKVLDGFEAVEFDDGELVVAVNVFCEVSANFSVSFDAWDSVDREYIAIGSDEYGASEYSDFNVLIKFSLNGGDVEISNVELLASYLTFDVGEISPWDSMDQEDVE